MKPIKKAKKSGIVQKLQSILKSKNVSLKLTLNIDNKTISDDVSLSVTFTTFLHQKLLNYSKWFQRLKKSFDSFLTKSNKNTFFLPPTTPE